MKIVFFGTPDFAVPSLDVLYKNNHEIAAVVTAPDKERGRGRKVTPTAVKSYALEKNIPVLQPEKMKDENFGNQLTEINADLFVVVAFRILPPEVFTLPKKGSFNLHGSLLPRYRGAAPIQWALINGETKTGLTTFFLQEKVDTGNMILQKEVDILEDDNLESLHDRMSLAGAGLVLETVKLIEVGKADTKEQDNTQATPAPKITKETALLDFNKSAEKVNNLVRGLSPAPGAWFEKNGKIYKVYKSKAARQSNLKPGEVLEEKGRLFIGCGENALEIIEIQPEGRKRMSASDFLRGYTLK